MNNFTFENQGTNTYLVYKVEEDDVLDNISLGMLTNNKIPGLSPALFTQMNDDKFIKYNISAQISAKQLFLGTVNRKRLLSVFKGVADTLLALDDYMIDAALVLLNLNYIFVDPSTYEISMICLPVTNVSDTVSFYDFVKNIMFSTQFEQSENCDYVTRIINFINANPAFSPNSFKQIINSLVDNGTQTSAVNNPIRPATPSVIHTSNIFNPNKAEPPVMKPIEKPMETMAPPITNKVNSVPPPIFDEPATSTKNISWFYLMQHYNAENAAAYKAQKEAKKQAAKKNPPSAKQKKAKNNSVDMGFAIPGMETPVTPVPSPSTSNVVTSASAPSQPSHISATPVSDSVINQTVTPPVYTPWVPVFDDFSYEEGTVVISTNQAERQLSPCLIRRKNGEKIQVNQPIFKIGRSSELNDYNIEENKFIGHCHCHIIARDTGFYIVDDNSRNHTYVDGQMITGSVEVQITDGCIIRLADEDFEFKLY